MPLQPFIRPPAPAPLRWPLSEYALSPWMVFPHRQDIFLVIDTDPLQPANRQRRLKVVWKTNVLEDVDLTALAEKTSESSAADDESELTYVVLGRSPSVGIKYPREGDIHSFQVRLTSEGIYNSAVARLKRENCKVRSPSTPEGSGEQDPQDPYPWSSISGRVYAIRGQEFPRLGPTSTVPPGRESLEIRQESTTHASFTGCYSSTGPGSGPTGPEIRLPKYPQEPSSTRRAVDYPHSQLGSHPLGSEFQVHQSPQEPPQTSPCRDHPPCPPGPRPVGSEPGPPLPPQFESRFERYGPPPQQQTANGSYREPVVCATGPAGSGGACAAVLPPGSRGTPSLSQAIACPMRYPTLRSGSGAGPACQVANSGRIGREAAAPSSPGPQITAREDEICGAPEYRDAASFHFRDQMGIGQALDSASPHPTRWPPATASARPKCTGGTINRQRDVNRGHGLPKDTRPGQAEGEDFAQTEDFVVNSLQDDGFRRLVERIGVVWQIMGFDSAAPRMMSADMSAKEGA